MNHDQESILRPTLSLFGKIEKREKEEELRYIPMASDWTRCVC